jgi:hypothetical protein
MDFHEYKKELAEWKKKHTDFYNEYVHALKSRKSTLATYMHVYEFAMKQIPNLPANIELGACDDLFNTYYEKYGFSKLIGMLASVIGNDQFFGIKSLAQRNKLEKAIAAWLILGDLHTCIINKVVSYSDKGNYEDSLNKLLCRIIKNSLITELKDENYWRSVQSKKQLFSKDEELEDLLALIKKEIAESKNSETSQQKTLDVEKQVESVKKKKGKPGRKPKFGDLQENTLEAFIEYSIGNQGKAEAYTQKIVDQLTKCSTGEELAALAVALEHLSIIKCIDNGGVKTFWNMLHKKCNSIVGYEAMIDSYNKLEEYNKKGKVPIGCASGMRKITDYIEILQETKNEHDNGIQETSIKAN